MAKKKKPTKNKPNKGITAASLTKDERIKLLLGFFTFSFSIYLLFAFISYLFTWQIDQSKLDITFFELFKDASITVENWSGKLGAMLAHKFMHDWFGIASYSIVFLMGLLGIRFFNYRLLPFRRTLKYVLIVSIWLSIALGFLFHNASFLPGGTHGYFISEWLNSFIGKLGTTFVLLIALFGILVYSFEGFIAKVKKFFKSLLASKVEDQFLTDIENNSENNGGSIAQDPFKTEPRFEKPVEDDEKEQEKSDDDSFSFEYTSKSEETEIKEEQKSTDNSNEFIGLDNIETIEVKVVDKETGEESESKDETKTEGDGLELDVEKIESEDDAPVKKIADQPVGDYDPTLDLSNYKLPPVDLLVDHSSGDVSVTEDELHSNKNRIVETLANYKIQIDKIKAIVGPTITLYEIVPAPGVRISKIKNLEDDIALSLAALGIRIIAPIPGRGTIGIEVPNLKPQVVSMRSIIASKKFQKSEFELPIALGKTISNETFVVDLCKMPHLLVAGATGQGKSVGLNAILTSMLYKKHPSQLKLVLVDPKKVELTLYQKLEKYFLAMLPDTEEAIITDTMKVVNTLNSLCIEMDARYDLLKAAHTRNIKEYNAKFISRNLNPEKGHRFLPYIVVVVDEFADLIMTAGKEVELPIARLAQLARAIGIHLIIATQRPTTNIITGLIKANFPARIAFRVTSMMDSRTILDSPGANQLIGRGDMLISQGSDVVRLQCAFVDTPEIEEIMNFIQQQQSYSTPYYLPEYVSEETSDPGNVDLSKKDVLFEDAARIIVANQQGSTSLVQRKFSIGYNRAGRIVDQLEAAGIVGSFEGSKARQVLIPDEYSLEQLLNNLN
ncbi:MAG: DNA translocase FtsK 4TM domain-containing protein [Salinivirgaceae bacterium]|jgi:S-DNA-T family DNA segregation ATPase FtsK/SpoIIIE|nr:DNA translocase FtsK 4TM domain-containing protein [Salinivirgaceae bacterium]